MFKREAAVLVAGDASETAYAGHTPNGELAAAIQISFTAAERQQLEAQQFSSTLREALGPARSFRCCWSSCRQTYSPATDCSSSEIIKDAYRCSSI